MYDEHVISTRMKKDILIVIYCVFFFAALSLPCFSDGTKENNTHSYAKKEVD